MKSGHKAHHHRRASGGEVNGDAKTGSREWEEDLKTKPERYAGGKPESEAEERKHGGRAKRKSGGSVMHHEHGKHLGHAKHVGMVHGHAAAHHAGRKARKSGGRAGSNENPLSSAHKGMEPKGHKDTEID